MKVKLLQFAMLAMFCISAFAEVHNIPVTKRSDIIIVNTTQFASSDIRVTLVDIEKGYLGGFGAVWDYRFAVESYKSVLVLREDLKELNTLGLAL